MRGLTFALALACAAPAAAQEQTITFNGTLGSVYDMATLTMATQNGQPGLKVTYIVDTATLASRAWTDVSTSNACDARANVIDFHVGEGGATTDLVFDYTRFTCAEQVVVTCKGLRCEEEVSQVATELYRTKLNVGADIRFVTTDTKGVEARLTGLAVDGAAPTAFSNALTRLNRAGGWAIDVVDLPDRWPGDKTKITWDAPALEVTGSHVSISYFAPLGVDLIPDERTVRSLLQVFEAQGLYPSK